MYLAKGAWTAAIDCVGNAEADLPVQLPKLDIDAERDK